MNYNQIPDSNANEQIPTVIDALLKAFSEGNEVHIESNAELQKGINYLLNIAVHFEVSVAASGFQQSYILPSTGQNDPVQYDVFVSHAWEDKESFVNEFVAQLESAGVSVWYDKTQIFWGDSMRERMDQGLLKSRFAVVVLSPNYIREGAYWTKAELDGIFQMETINGKMLLPIWHKLKRADVLHYSPIIASKLAMNTESMTPAEIAQEVVKILQRAKQTSA